MNYEQAFWQETERYHDLARHFDRHVERIHPAAVTSKRMCPCLEFSAWCDWACTSVDYYEYRGEAV